MASFNTSGQEAFVLAASIPTGSNVIGAVTQSGTWAVNISDNGASITVDNAGTFAVQAAQSGSWSLNSVVPGTGATNLGKAEDAAHTSGAVGVMALAVRNDAGTALAGTTGDYIPLSTDSSGALMVTGGGGGTQYTQGDTQASPVGTVAMGKDSSNVLKALPLDASGYLQVNVAAGGGSGGTSSSYGSAVPSTGTAAGFSDGTNLQLGRVYDTDSGAGTQYTLGVSLRKTSSGGSVELGTSADPVRVDPTGTTAQPVTDNGGSLTVDGTVAATQSGSWTLAANSGVDIGDVTINNASGASAVNIQDGGNSITVDGTVTANAGTGNFSVNLAQVAATTTATGNGTASAGCQRVTIASDNTAFNVNAAQATASSLNAQVVGNIAHGSADSGNPVKVGGKARTTNPTAVADGDRVDCFRDDVGRSVVVLNQCRDLVGSQVTVITSSTTETTIVTAGGAGVIRELTNLSITNSSATALVVTLKDATAGTTRGQWAIAGNGGIVIPYPTPKKQSSANNNWTLTCGTSVASIYVVAEYVDNV
jgi:hypothetical protein